MSLRDPSREEMGSSISTSVAGRHGSIYSSNNSYRYTLVLILPRLHRVIQRNAEIPGCIFLRELMEHWHVRHGAGKCPCKLPDSALCETLFVPLANDMASHCALLFLCLYIVQRTP